jgi:hypothetical protein
MKASFLLSLVERGVDNPGQSPLQGEKKKLRDFGHLISLMIFSLFPRNYPCDCCSHYINYLFGAGVL